MFDPYNNSRVRKNYFLIKDEKMPMLCVFKKLSCSGMEIYNNIIRVTPLHTKEKEMGQMQDKGVMCLVPNHTVQQLI